MPTLDSIFGDVPDLDSRKAAEIAADGEKWKTPQAFKALLTSIWVYAAKLLMGDLAR